MNENHIQGTPPEGSLKAVMGDLAWQNLTRYAETVPPQSIAVEVKHGQYTYRGTAYLVTAEDTPSSVLIN